MTLQLLRADGAVRRKATVVALTQRADESDDSRICCRNCGNQVALVADRMAVDGSHTHVKTNPLGLRFHLGCFQAADGCRCDDAYTHEYSWFAAYVWCCAFCHSCRTHLAGTFSPVWI